MLLVSALLADIFSNLQLWPLMLLQPLGQNQCLVPYLKDVFHKCLETKAQGFWMNSKVSNLGSKWPHLHSAYVERGCGNQMSPLYLAFCQKLQINLKHLILFGHHVFGGKILQSVQCFSLVLHFVNFEFPSCGLSNMPLLSFIAKLCNETFLALILGCKFSQFRKRSINIFCYYAKVKLPSRIFHTQQSTYDCVQ